MFLAPNADSISIVYSLVMNPTREPGAAGTESAICFLADGDYVYVYKKLCV
jgi:hypothetical protein